MNGTEQKRITLSELGSDNTVALSPADRGAKGMYSQYVVHDQNGNPYLNLSTTAPGKISLDFTEEEVYGLIRQWDKPFPVYGVRSWREVLIVNCGDKFGVGFLY
jgi:hypothetical protein